MELVLFIHYHEDLVSDTKSRPFQRFINGHYPTCLIERTSTTFDGDKSGKSLMTVRIETHSGSFLERPKISQAACPEILSHARNASTYNQLRRCLKADIMSFSCLLAPCTYLPHSSFG